MTKKESGDLCNPLPILYFGHFGQNSESTGKDNKNLTFTLITSR